jgi:hypothetical protein
MDSTLSDTSPKAADAYFRRLREMTACDRIALAVDLWEAGHALQRAGLRRLHPTADEDEITFRIAVSRWGLELAEKVYRKPR